PILRDIVDIGDIKISRPNQVSNLPIMRKELFVERQHPVFLLKGGIRVVQPSFKKGRSRTLLRGCRNGRRGLVTERLCLSLCRGQLLPELVSFVAGLLSLSCFRLYLLLHPGDGGVRLLKGVLGFIHLPLELCNPLLCASEFRP